MIPDQPAPAGEPIGILGHRVETDRLWRLNEFLANFAPAIGRSRNPGTPADEAAGGEITRARDEAIVEAFRAVSRISAASFNFGGESGGETEEV